MKRAFLIPLALGLVCSFSTFSVQAASVSQAELLEAKMAVENDVDAERIAYMVNQARRQNGAGELQMLPRLNRIAAIRAEEITRSFSHTRPDGSGIQQLIDQNNIGWRKIGENIAAGQSTPEMAMNSWMNSENHRKNILNPDYQYIGVASCYANGIYYWVQIFLRPSSTVNPGAYFPRNFGDVNDDGAIDGVDATTVLTDYAVRSVGQQGILDEPHLDIADMTRDGIVNAVDATEILSVYAAASIN